MILAEWKYMGESLEIFADKIMMRPLTPEETERFLRYKVVHDGRRSDAEVHSASVGGLCVWSQQDEDIKFFLRSVDTVKAGTVKAGFVRHIKSCRADAMNRKLLTLPIAISGFSSRLWL